MKMFIPRGLMLLMLWCPPWKWDHAEIVLKYLFLRPWGVLKFVWPSTWRELCWRKRGTPECGGTVMLLGLDCWVFFTSALSFVFVFCICVFEFNGTVIFLGFDWLFSFTVRTTNKQTRSQLWNTQIIYYLCMKKHKCTFSTFPHFQGWPPQDLQQAGVSTCCDGFGTKSSPKFVFNQSF